MFWRGFFCAYLCTAIAKIVEPFNTLFKMKVEKFVELAWAIIVVKALVEAVCGKKFMKRISERMKVLDFEAEAEVWIGVFNQVCPDKKLSTGNNALAHSQVVREESSNIFEKLKSTDTFDIDTVNERMNKIMIKKIKSFDEAAKRL